jgi:hypothetical protein
MGQNVNEYRFHLEKVGRIFETGVGSRINAGYQFTDTMQDAHRLRVMPLNTAET